MLNIRPAVPADAPTIANLVRELADYEKLLDEARATPQDFLRELESPNPVIRVLIAEWNGEPCGFALYFRGILTVLDGLVQLGGLGIVGEGIFMTTESSAAPPGYPSPRSRASPTLLPRGSC